MTVISIHPFQLMRKRMKKKRKRTREKPILAIWHRISSKRFNKKLMRKSV
jgi:hypothetical protein